MVLEPLESVTTPEANEVADPSFVSPPPPIRRDDELPSVTGELSSEIGAPQVPQFPSSKPTPQAVAPPTTPRRRFRRQSRETGTVSTRTSGGTVVTFPPQNAPGSGPGEIGRVTSSVPAVAPGAPPSANLGSTGIASAPVAPDVLLDPAELAPSPRVEPTPERAGFLVAPSAQDRVRDVGAAAESGPWLLIDPEDVGRADTVPDASSDEPVVETEAETETETMEAAPAKADDAATAGPEDQERLVDLEYLFAASTIDVGPIDLSTSETQIEVPAEPVAFADPVTPVEPVTLAEPVVPVPPQIPEIQSASTIPAPGPSAIARPVVSEANPADDFDARDDLDALLAEFSIAMAPARTSEPKAEPAPDVAPPDVPEIDTPDESSDELAKPTGFGIGEVTVPSAEVIDHAAVIERGETVDLNLADITVPSAEVVDQSVDSALDAAPELDVASELESEFDVAPELESELDVASELESEPVADVPADIAEPAPPALPQPPGDPAPSGGMFFETLNRRQTESSRSPRRVAKSPAEVFASETSLLPARTRRGDQMLVEPHDVGHSWFNKSGELPLLNLTDDGKEVRTERRTGAFVKRTLLTVLILVAIIGCLYVALNSIYL